MKRFAALGTLGALLFCATGCGGPDALMKEFITYLDAYAQTLEKREPKEKQIAAQERVRTTIEKMDKLKLSSEEKEKLLARYEGEFKKAKERVEAAHKALAMEGGGADVPDLFSNFTPKQ